MAIVDNLDFLKSDLDITKNHTVVIVKTSWNKKVVDSLELECIKVLKNYGIKKIITIEVPGAVEISFIIKKVWEENNISKKNNISAFIALGCVIKGDTPHFEYVCQMISYSIAKLNLIMSVPTIMGVLTVNTHTQAKVRITKSNHKGKEFALSAIKMIHLNSKTYKN